MFPDWEAIAQAVKNFGWVKGTFLLFFWFAHFWIYWLYQGRLKDRQRQIDALAKENKEYRERFLDLVDRHFGYTDNHAASQDKQSGNLLPAPPSPTSFSSPNVPPKEEQKPVEKPKGKKKNN